jgi:hypothetical protein
MKTTYITKVGVTVTYDPEKLAKQVTDSLCRPLEEEAEKATKRWRL